MKKYVFTGKTKQSANGEILRQIQAVRNLPSLLVKAGDIGGWIESEENLSHHGDCWVFPGSQVSANARITENAGIYDSTVSGDAAVRGNAKVCKNANVYDHADISDNAYVVGPIHVYGDTKVDKDTVVCKSIHGYPAQI